MRVELMKKMYRSKIKECRYTDIDFAIALKNFAPVSFNTYYDIPEFSKRDVENYDKVNSNVFRDLTDCR
jgi:hypothetical protein